MAALEYGNYLAENEDGIPVLKRIILDDLEAAKRRSDRDQELKLKMVLKHFVDIHPLAKKL